MQAGNDLTSGEAELNLAELKPTMAHIANLQNEAQRLYELLKASNIVAPLTGAVVKHRCIAEILSRYFRRAIVSYTREIFWRTSFKDNFVPTHVRQVT